jgi:hypothetical protein
MISDDDKLRNATNALLPDSRTKYLVTIDHTNQSRNITLQDQHNFISPYILNDQVPEEIRIQFETAKNCYLYAWFVFRFYQVAEQHAFSTLEYALRLRLPDFVKMIESKSRLGIPPGLGSLLNHAKNKNILRNELFESRNNWARNRAKDRYRQQIHKKMVQDNLVEITYDDSNIEATEDDLNFDWLGAFIECLPSIRNDLAHGSSNLQHGVLHTFDVVSSMLNMMFTDTAQEK